MQELQLICSCCGQPYYPNKSWEDRLRAVLFGAERFAICPICAQAPTEEVFRSDMYHRRCILEVRRLQLLYEEDQAMKGAWNPIAEFPPKTLSPKKGSRSMRWIIPLLLLTGSIPAVARNRNPKDYPQKATVVSFQRQPCIRQIGSITRVCHIIVFEVEGQNLTGSCFRCDPLLPGKTYPARLDQKNLVLFVIHEKGNGSWGQDDYAITQMDEQTEKPGPHL